MELVPGDTLAERLAAGPLSVRESLRYAHGISRALEAAHTSGVVHRDLKPLNVKITPDGEVKLLDFGLAKMLVDTATDSTEDDETLLAESELTAAGTVLGTTSYMSPEQIRGGEVGRRADIWAFGCVLFEMLTGGRPFTRASEPDTLAAILKEEVDLANLPAETPAGINSLVERCLRKQSDRRLHHIADARIEIEEALHGSGSSASSSGARSASAQALGSAPRTPGKSWKMVVAAVITLAALASLWKLLPSEPSQPITDRTIAVLPFTTLGQTEASVFTDGVHGDMLTKLSKIGDLQVTSRTSVMPFRDSLTPIPEIARRLGVAWVLQGEVQEIAGQVQVSARLVDAQSDRQVWAESYQRDLTAENLFQIQGELTRQIVDQLAVQLSPEQQKTFDQVPTDNLDAYRLYVQGRALLDPRTERDLTRSVEYFRQAIAQDGIYGLAWAGLANALALQGFYDYRPLDEVLPEALAAAQRALDLDPELAEGHASKGIVLSLERKGSETVEALRRSIELNPSFAPSHAWLGWVQDLLGNPTEALPAARRAAELNPLSPAYRAWRASLCYRRVTRGRRGYP
jgi:TolB-like protein